MFTTVTNHNEGVFDIKYKSQEANVLLISITR